MSPIYLQNHSGLQPVANSSAAALWLRELGRAHGIFCGMGANIATATEEGKRLYPVVRNFLRNPYVKLSAAARAIGGVPDRSRVISLRNQVDPWETKYPPITWFNMDKPDGSTRPICLLPLELKTVHYMIAEVIKKQFQRKESIFGVPGFSRDDAARRLKDLQSSGYVHLAKSDIVNCFQSINPDALYQLPLPKEVTRRALDTRYLMFAEHKHYMNSRNSYMSTFREHTSSHKASGPQGLMQGSPASSIILAWLLNAIPSHADTKVIMCFDNLVIASKTWRGSREMVNTLADQFERCPAGPLALCPPEFADNSPLEFLGYLFDPSRSDIGIGEKALHRLECRLNVDEVEDLKNLQKKMEKHQSLVKESSLFNCINPLREQYPISVWKTLRDFRAGFPATSPEAKELQFYLDSSEYIADMRQDPTISHLHRNLFAQNNSPEVALLKNIINARFLR